MEKIKVLIVDDHRIIRDGVKSLLEKAGFEVVGSVSSGEEAITFARQNIFSVIIMDVLMEGMTGIEATRWIKDLKPTMKVILLTTEISKEYVSAGIKSGVDGYLPKDVDSETLMTAINVVLEGGRFFTDAIMKLVFEDFYTHEKLKSGNTKLPNDLSKRESEVLGWVAKGKSNRELAEILFISVKTVESHKAKVMEKLGLRNTAELIKYAIKNNIISVDSF